jgi:hypothetical protein
LLLFGFALDAHPVEQKSQHPAALHDPFPIFMGAVIRGQDDFIYRDQFDECAKIIVLIPIVT